MESKNNGSFKEQLISDMVKILQEDISETSRKHIIDMYCWLLTERKSPYNGKSKSRAVDKNAKYKGCDYWTDDALALYTENKNSNGLRHEHVVPRKLFVDYVNSNVNNIEVDKINKFFIGCVVTKKQAEEIDRNYKEKMPKDEKFEDINEKNLWSRYTLSKIKAINKVNWESKPRGWENAGKTKIEILENTGSNT